MAQVRELPAAGGASAGRGRSRKSSCSPHFTCRGQKKPYGDAEGTVPPSLGLRRETLEPAAAVGLRNPAFPDQPSGLSKDKLKGFSSVQAELWNKLSQNPAVKLCRDSRDVFLLGNVEVQRPDSSL